MASPIANVSAPMTRMALISHSRAVSARIGTAAEHAVLQDGDAMGLPHLREPVRHGLDVVPTPSQSVARRERDAAFEAHEVSRIGWPDAPVHEARALDGFLYLHAVVERIAQDLRVEHGLPVAAHAGQAQHRPTVASHHA